MREVLLLFCLCASIANAATYYVDYGAGNDANDGISMATAFKRVPGDVAATGTATATTNSLAPGDFLLINTTNPYVLTSKDSAEAFIRVTASGTPASPITFGKYGSGQFALVTSSNIGGIGLRFPYGFSNIVVRGWEFTEIGGTNILPPDAGQELTGVYGACIVAEVGFLGVTIADYKMHRIGFWQNVKPSGSTALGGHGIRAAGAASGQALETDGLTITNGELSRVKQPIQINSYKTTRNVEIVKNYWHDYFEWCMDIVGVDKDNTLIDNFSVHDNYFLDFDRWYSVETWSGYGEPPHQNGIYFRMNVDYLVYQATNINFYNNHFHGSGGWSGGTTGGIYAEGPARCRVYGNVFDNPQAANSMVQLQMFSSAVKNTNAQIWVMNNTMFLAEGKIGFSCGAAIPYYYDWVTNNHFHVTNNVLVRSGAASSGLNFVMVNNLTNYNEAYTNGGPQSISMDYNATWNNNFELAGGSDIHGVTQPGFVLYAFSQYGWDANSTTQAATFVSSTLGDYRITNCVHTNMGLSIPTNSFPGFDFDLWGNRRSSAQAIGAFAFSSLFAARPARWPRLPTNLAASTNTPGTIALSWTAPGYGSPTGYVVFRAYTNLAGKTQLDTFLTTNTATSFTDSSATQTTNRYFYTVAAVNEVGIGPQTATANGIPAGIAGADPARSATANAVRAGRTP